MSGSGRNVRPGGDHPSAGLLAAHAERRLQRDEEARIDEHLAACNTCYEVFAETARFLLDEPEAEAPKPSAAVPFARRPTFLIPAALAVAATLLVAVWVWRPRVSERPTLLPADASPLVAELAGAVGTRRFVEPRLTGGFQHGRLVALRSDAPPAGLDAQPPDVLAAVARIRARAQDDPSAEALGALGVTYLVSGDVGAAVKALESATQQEPRSARLQSDLAAAYLVRASRLDEPADLPKALEAAEKAIALEQPPHEAWFNRALALESLHLVGAASQAWQDYLERDATSAWAEEARQHLEQLPRERQSSAEEDRTRVRAALDGGAVDRLAQAAPSLLRDYFQATILPAWADAQIAARGEAAQLREEAQLVGDALLKATGDALPRDTARSLDATGADPSRLHVQALGLKALDQGRRLYDRREPSCAVHRAALRDLRTAGSPRAEWARLHVVITCLFANDQRAAGAELSRIEAIAIPRRYGELLGRVRWMQGLVLAESGDLTASLDRYRLARGSFAEIREPTSEAGALALIAQNLTALGESRRAWHERVRTLALLVDLEHPHRRHAILDEAVQACLAERLPRAGLHFEDALVASTMRQSAANASSEALLRRAELRYALGARAMAAADLREARRLIPRVPDPIVQERLEAQAEATSAALLAETDPRAAARSLAASLGHFRATAPMRAPALELLLARALLNSGQASAAERELLAGIEELERQRVSLRDVRMQVSFFDQGLPLFDDMVRMRVDRGDGEGALAFVERGRSRQLLDALRAGHASIRRESSGEPRALQGALDPGVALIYYAALDDRLLIWVLSHDSLRFVTRPIAASRLRQLVARHRAALDRDSARQAARATGAALHDELLRPLPELRSSPTLIVVPDQTLQGLSFASLVDSATGRYVVEDHVLGVAPSGSVFVATSAAASSFAAGSRALVVGNPRFDRTRHAGLPDLPGAEAEATEIAGLYDVAQLLTGSQATKAAFLDGIQSSPIVHYAGHASSDSEGERGHLLLAPGVAPADPGILPLDELAPGSMRHVRLVVLAACRTATGRISSTEGSLNLGRPLLAAGVPDVLAGLWDIDDAISRRFFVDFHRAFLASGEPLAALRRTQVAFLSSTDPALAHPSSWAGFVCLGGLDRRRTHPET